MSSSFNNFFTFNLQLLFWKLPPNLSFVPQDILDWFFRFWTCRNNQFLIVFQNFNPWLQIGNGIYKCFICCNISNFTQSSTTNFRNQFLYGTVWPDWNRLTGCCHWDDFRGTTKAVEMEMVVAGKVNLKVGKKFLNLNGLKFVEILSVGEMWTKWLSKLVWEIISKVI